MPDQAESQKGLVAGLAHICFTVADLERSIDFYCRQLGMTPAFEFRRPDGTHYGQYIHVGGRNFVELFIGELAEPAEKQAYRHLCLEVPNIERAAAAFRANGVEVTEIKLGGDQSYQAWLEDPDGNRIELHQYTATSKQGAYLE
jgi:catechol 2,3-dioxygenase-like lactoylglutathione lyase family enzyme